MAVLLTNRKARFEYHILDSYQAGLSLSGAMVKAIRLKKVNPDNSYVIFQHGQLQIIGLETGDLKETIPLLLKEREIHEIVKKTQDRGYTCVVLNLKTVGRWLKAEIAVAKGKNKADKRETIKKRDLDREINRDT